jgi:23S rRNA (guanosine2251-2'-O)-methyltransferase
LKKLTTKEILQQNLKRSSPLKDNFILWLHDIRSLHNVGAVFRCADAFGISELWLSGITPVPPRPEITKTAIGAEEYVTWKKIDDEFAAISELKKNRYMVLGLEQTDNSILIQDIDTSANAVCLIVGNEVTGIDSKLLAHLDASVEIPQFGMKHSLNVSVAAGVALYAFLMKKSG